MLYIKIVMKIYMSLKSQKNFIFIIIYYKNFIIYYNKEINILIY